MLFFTKNQNGGKIKISLLLRPNSSPVGLALFACLQSGWTPLTVQVACSGIRIDDLRQKMKGEMPEMLMWARVNREKRHVKHSS